MGKPVKRLIKLLYALLTAAAVLLALALVGLRLTGLRAFSVLSGSMEPLYPTGSLIYVKPVDKSLLKSGDVITFMLDASSIATHRIVEVIPDASDASVIRYRTKGDANSAPDGALVHCRNVLGSPVFCLPWLGYFAQFVRKPPGSYMALSAGALVILLAFLPDLLGSGAANPKGTKPKGSQIIISNTRRDSQE